MSFSTVWDASQGSFQTLCCLWAVAFAQVERCLEEGGGIEHLGLCRTISCVPKVCAIPEVNLSFLL